MAKKNEKELTLKSLAEECEGHGLECFLRDEKALNGLWQYLSLLMKWNKVMNLVGKSRWDEALRILVADSAYLYPFLTRLQGDGYLDSSPLTWDLGAGAGLPGIPLRLLWQDGRYILVDSREKRTLFLKTVLASHDFGETEVVQARVEDFFPGQPEAQMIISRAFMPWEQVLELVAPHTANGGLAVFLTLLPAPQEFGPSTRYSPTSRDTPEGRNIPDTLKTSDAPETPPRPDAPGTHNIPHTLDYRWKLVREERYTIQKDTRYLWALQLEK